MVHQYQLNGYNIVLDTCSGSVHVVDDVAYDVIAMYKEHSADEIVAAHAGKVWLDRPDVTEADLRQCLEDVASLEVRRQAVGTRRLREHGLRLQEPPDGGEGALPPRRPHLQPQLLLLLRLAGPLSGRPRPDELRGGQAGHGLPHRELRHPPQPRGRFLRRRAADELRHGEKAGGLLPRAGEDPQQELPLHHDHQRRAHRRRRHRLLQQGVPQRRAEPRWPQGGPRPLPQGLRRPWQL